MANEEHEPNYCTPMVSTQPDKGKVVCRDCEFKDRAVVSAQGVDVPVGVTRSFCKMYPDGRGKPIGILLRNEDCDFHSKE